MKTVLVPVGDASLDGSAIETGLSLARDFEGHADCVFITGEISEMVPPAALGLFELVQSQMAEEFEQERSRKQALAHQLFRDLLEKLKIDYRKNAVPGDLSSASWEVASGAASDVVATRGGAYDLVVVGQTRSDHTSVGELSAEAALFRTGRPVLIAAPGMVDSVGESIVIGWNRTPNAARATAAALPFLHRARQITIVSVRTGAKQGPSPRDMAGYLSWHGVRAEVTEIEPDHRLVGEVLLEEAERVSADLLVMGAFSHSRLRELVLGGVTRHILQQAEIPVLMAH